MAARKKREPLYLRLRLDKFIPSGECVGLHGNRQVRVWGGLPGEEVTVHVIKKRRGAFIAIISEIHQPSPLRVSAGEEHHLSCSPWQVLRYDEESGVKQQLVREIFEQRFEISLPQFDVLTGEEFGYRNKLEFSFDDTPEGVSLSFFKRGSWRLKSPTQGCILGQAAINTAAKRIVDVLLKRGVFARFLKALVLRSSRSGHVTAALYIKLNIEPLGDLTDRTAGLTGFRVFYSDPKSPASVPTELREEYGSPLLEETLLGRKFRYCDQSFFQVNVPMFEHALRDIVSHVTEDSLIYDIYSGVGTIGLSTGSKNLVFIESNESAQPLLRENCAMQGIADPTIIIDRAELALATIPEEAIAIIDPPRVGMHPKALAKIIESRPRRIIYLACNPISQADNLTNLLPHYNLTYFRAYNFFPRTPHVETLAILDRKS